MNNDDFISYFPLSQWGFTRYGKTTANVSISGMCQSEWENQFGKEYKRMDSPTAPLNEFVKVSPSRNECYNKLLLQAHSTKLPSYPDNTRGYYSIMDLSSPTLNSYMIFHAPMFLMKYFAAVAAKEVPAVDFALLDVAPALVFTKTSVLLNIPEIQLFTEDSVFKTSMVRIEHPHMPETYYFLAPKIDQQLFCS